MRGGRTNERTDEQKSLCVLQDFVPFGAAAQKGHPDCYSTPLKIKQTGKLIKIESKNELRGLIRGLVVRGGRLIQSSGGLIEAREG